MFHFSEKLKKLEDKLNAFIAKHKSKFPTYIGLGLVILYFYGMLLRFIGIVCLLIFAPIVAYLVVNHVRRIIARNRRRRRRQESRRRR